MKRRKQKICATPFCKKKTSKGNFCKSCVSKKFRAAHPVKAAYNTLRDNAKRRGKFFDLTFEQFEKFCIETDYIAGKGRTKTSYTIDRENDDEGYTISNIRVLTNTNNVKKRWHLDYDWQTKQVSIIKHTADLQTTDNYF